MCGKCAGYGLISAVATWGFFALLLTLLGVANALVNAIWLALLIFAATISCPVMNPKIATCCQTEPVKTKKKK